MVEGAGFLPRPGDEVGIHCEASIDGDIPDKFWSTKDPGQKIFRFKVGKRQVIRGIILCYKPITLRKSNYRIFLVHS